MTRKLYPAEFIFPGHPDKLSDAIADALVEQAWHRDPRALVGVEVAVHRDHVYITGRIACSGAETINVAALVRQVYESAGYNKDWYPAPDQVHVISNLCLGPLEEGEAEFRELSDDQAICTGYANALQATNHLPVEHWLVSQVARRLHQLRVELPDLNLGPDGKVLVLVEERLSEDARSTAWWLRSFSCSLQQRGDSDEVALHRAVRLALQEVLVAAAECIPGFAAELPDQLTVNGAGDFEVGGPEGDNGLSGKKLVVDAFGPRVPIGGGAWSGKDFFKADRAGGMHARRLAKAIIRLGVAREATVTLGWFPGDSSARIVRIVDERGQSIDAAGWEQYFDLSLKHSGERFAVPNLQEISRWGHFSDRKFPWEAYVRV
jgi:S-adenosylmethionine synthetase